MVPPTASTQAPLRLQDPPACPGIEGGPGNYDRSSMPDGLLVMIPGQSPEDFERSAPVNRFCEYIDGVVYMPSPVTDRHQDLTNFFIHLLDGFDCERGIGHVLSG